MKFILTLTNAQINEAYQEALKETAKTANIKGFRQGKAPLDAVEKATDKAHLMEHGLSHLLPHVYAEYIQKNSLKPITDPKITLKSSDKDKDWEFEVEIAERPEVKLNDYQQAVKGAKAVDKIWTPGKGEPEKAPSPEDQRQESLIKAFDALLKTCTLEIPELLVEQEVNRALSQLLNQVNKLGMNIDQYLGSIGKTSESLREEYKTTATDNLKLEFILDAIAKDRNFIVPDQEVNDFIEKIDDPKLKEAVSKSALEKAAISHTLLKRQTVDFLLSL